MPPAVRLAVLGVLAAVAVALAIQAMRGGGTRTRTLLLTGFGPFGDVEVNPSWEAIRELEGVRIGDTVLRTARLDVTYADAPGQLRAAIAKTSPDAVLCLGVAPGEELRLEIVARNRDSSAAPDVSGEARQDHPIREDGPLVLPTTLPVQRLLGALIDGGFEVRTSEDAGGYLCNHVFYRLMDEGERLGPSGFVHVPELKGPWTLERLRGAIRCIVEVHDRSPGV